ncbi:MAG: signal peptide peptidase SppA [Niabella sp.]
MKSFLKYFLACLLAIIVFGIISMFFFMGLAGAAMSGAVPKVGNNSVLVIDLSHNYEEQPLTDMQTIIREESIEDKPGLYNVIRLIQKAKKDEKISGIYIVANTNINGFATSDEIRAALEDFKSSKKFVIAYGDVMSQKAYSVANMADKIYVSPKGFFEWTGYSVNLMFIKGTLDKLEIKPQIFYAGKFKSATEPLRATEMTEPNKLQTAAWMNELYANLLHNTAIQRKLDTAILHHLADNGSVQTPQDAVTNKLIDGAWYDDEVKDEIKKQLKLDSTEKINFLSIEKYASVHRDFSSKGDNIALIYASGDIVDGKGGEGKIGSENYVNLIRKARLDKDIKAIVLRVNSGGGSALASENIWREMTLAKKEKPVIVSFGDVAASGGYYISCAADSIFASPNTITGSIGVFGIIPDMSVFFKNKLGITFDGVATGPLANTGNIDHPMNEQEKKLIKGQIERIYTDFKERVAEGRKKDTAYIETIAQGRVWTGFRGKEIGIVDAFGGLEDAIKAAARMAKLKEFNVKEYPKQANLFERILGIQEEETSISKKMKEELGIEYYNVYKQLQQVKEMTNKAQTKLPFEFVIN